MAGSEYEKNAVGFLKETETTFKAEFFKFGRHLEDDTESRDIYKITLTRGERVYKFNFGQSIANSGFKLINKNTNKEVKYNWFNELTYNKDNDKKKLNKDIGQKLGYMLGLPFGDCLKIEFGEEPSAYDVLSCLQKNEVGTFEDFCGDFGYEEDSRKAERTYKAVLNEWQNIKILWSDEEIEKLQEIQ